MEQFYIQLKLGFEIVTETQAATSLCSPGSLINFQSVNAGIFDFIYRCQDLSIGTKI